MKKTIQEIENKIDQISNNKYLVDKKLTMLMSCGKSIVKQYKNTMSIRIAEKRASLAIQSHIKKCKICKSKRPFR